MVCLPSEKSDAWKDWKRKEMLVQVWCEGLFLVFLFFKNVSLLQGLGVEEFSKKPGGGLNRNYPKTVMELTVKVNLVLLMRNILMSDLV